MATQLNNAEAYRFINLYMVPTIIKGMEMNKVKCDKPSKSKSDSFDIILKAKVNGKMISMSPTIFYTGRTEISVSLHKMMCMKYLVTVANNTIYIISQEKLLSVWNNSAIVRIEKKTYRDGLGELAQLSHIKMSWLAENADYTYSISDDMMRYYIENLAYITK